MKNSQFRGMAEATKALKDPTTSAALLRVDYWRGASRQIKLPELSIFIGAELYRVEFAGDSEQAREKREALEALDAFRAALVAELEAL